MSSELLNELGRIKGIKPYFIPSLKPDLLFMYETRGKEFILEAIAEADPSNPSSIIFNNPLQKNNRLLNEMQHFMYYTDEDEQESLSLQCMKCKSRSVSYNIKQTRGRDEPPTIFAKCNICPNHSWTQ